jgi:hypothetical protein
LPDGVHTITVPTCNDFVLMQVRMAFINKVQIYLAGRQNDGEGSTGSTLATGKNCPATKAGGEPACAVGIMETIDNAMASIILVPVRMPENTTAAKTAKKPSSDSI